MSDPCFFIDMKKILCLLMAAVLAVVIMTPFDAEAASGSDLTINVRGGVPEVVGSVTSWGQGDISWPTVSYEIVLPISFDISNMPVGKYVDGYFSINTTLAFSALGSANYYWAQITDVKFSKDNYYADFYLGKNVSHEGPINDAESVYVNDTLGIYLNESMYVDGTVERFIAYVTYSVTLISDLGQPTATVINSVAGSSSYTGYGLYFNEYDYPLEKSWLMGRIDKLSNDLVSGISGVGQSIVNNIQSLNSNVKSWFETQWTNGRQWTDELIDAITGQSGGESIGTAQDELDNQLNSIENVEQQLSDQVLDKIDVPSISLSSDESGGLNWVVSTINSFYVAFDELHVMFACVVFFSICAVLLFGRRNL